MPKKPADNDEEREELVAYLDGELSEDEAHAVEAKLSRDPKARAEAEGLRKTWELLEYLPRPEPSPNFTNRTLDRVSALRPTVATPRPNRWKPLWFGLGWAAAVLLVAASGFGGALFFHPVDRTDEDLSRDLRVIENRRLYEAVGDIEFLKALDHPDLFGDEDSGG